MKKKVEDRGLDIEKILKEVVGTTTKSLFEGWDEKDPWGILKATKAISGYIREREMKCLEMLKEIVEAKRVADTTPELLLSSEHSKTKECIVIMNRYEDSFRKAQQLIDDLRGNKNGK
jgi:hypothetical protein